jgi:L-lysine exporter family protein LysE/ArgO
MIAVFISGFSLSLALIMAIGAQNLFVLRQGLKREHVGAVVLFCSLVDALLIIAGVSGLGAFLAIVPQLKEILAIGGAIFLIVYGLMALKRAITPEAMKVSECEKLTLKQALLTMAGFTFLNPHVYLDTVLLMGAAGAAQPDALRLWFILGASLASFVWFTSLGYGAQYLAPLFQKPLAWRILDCLVGVIMLVLAATLLL